VSEEHGGKSDLKLISNSAQASPVPPATKRNTPTKNISAKRVLG